MARADLERVEAQFPGDLRALRAYESALYEKVNGRLLRCAFVAMTTVGLHYGPPAPYAAAGGVWRGYG